MTESFLHYLWEFQYFQKHALFTTQGEAIEVFHQGIRNSHAGPDFFTARVKIGTMEWIGSVEIHIQASGWIEHRHNTDPAYENVVLHVVWNDNKPVIRADGSWLPTLELKNRVDEKLLLQYKDLVYNPESIPCRYRLGDVSTVVKLSMLDRVLAGRLESKAEGVLKTLQRNDNDWEETCYQLLVRNFGFKVNSEPFEQLSKSLPYKFLLKHADKPLQVEALLFGQAGFLEEENDEEYYRLLKREYRVLGQKYQLTTKRLKKVQWRFLRLRPANFPTIRIAQVAALVYNRRNFVSSILAIDSGKRLSDFFTVEQSPYWMHHYQFFKEMKEEINTLGEASIDNIIINTVVPLLVAYGKSKDDPVYVDRAVRILQHVHAETNSITNQWKSLGMSIKTAFDSQAVVALYNNYCLKKKCLDCNIGASLVNPRRK